MLFVISVTAGPTGTITIYIPFESVITVCIVLKLSVITTLTSGIAGLP